MEPIHWMYVIFTVPIALGAAAYIVMQIILKYRNRKKQLHDSVVTGQGAKFFLMADMQRTSVIAWYVYESDEPTPDMLMPGNSSGALFVLRYTLSFMPNDWHGKLEYLGNRYIALKIGDMYHSLYDIEEAKTLVHEADPQQRYAAWARDNGAEDGFSKELYVRWVYDHLHEPIEARLKKEGAL